MAEKLKVELQDDKGNIYYLHTGASVVFCEDGSTVQSKLNGMVKKSDIIQNATTAATDKVVSGAVAKNLQDQISEQNTKIKRHDDILTMTDGSYFSTPGAFRVQNMGGLAVLEIVITTKANIPAWTDVTIGQVLTAPTHQVYVQAITDQNIPVRVVINTNKSVVVGACGSVVGNLSVIRCHVPYFTNM